MRRALMGNHQVKGTKDQYMKLNSVSVPGIWLGRQSQLICRQLFHARWRVIQRLMSEVRIIQGRVMPALREQAVVIPFFDDRSLFHHNDPIGCLHS